MYTKSSITPFWQTQFKDLEYKREPFNCQEDVDLWRTQGFSQKEFSGKMYSMKNDMPAWTDGFLSVFNGSNITLCFYKMDTCNIIPRHQDKFSKYSNLFQITDKSSIYRAIIFLEDWKPGHVFEIDNDPITNWRAGDCISWQYDTPHMAANLGLEPRYTAQITFTHV